MKANKPLLRDVNADKWFEYLEKRVLGILDASPPSHEPVKIAILDTGVDMTHPLYRLEEIRDRIKRQDFTEPASGDIPRSEDDIDGHGTHISHVLLRVAPYAELYVGKVLQSSKEQDPNMAEHVAQVAFSFSSARFLVTD